MAVPYHIGQFPPAKLDWERLVPLIGPANAALARYDGLLTAIPNADVLLSPLTTQEAVLSSRIEGTQATMGEVLQYEAAGGSSLDPSKRDDIEEVLNYRQSMRQAVDEMRELPLCNRLIKELHKTLMSGVLGNDKARGRFRTTSASMADRSRKPASFRSPRKNSKRAWTAGKSISTNRPKMGWCNSLLFMRNSSRCIRFWTATAASGGC